MPLKQLSNNCQLYHGDCLAVLPTIPDNSIDLIATDPPYFQVKEDNWDNQWPDVKRYLAWFDNVLLHFFRILKPTGSFYLFCSKFSYLFIAIVCVTRNVLIIPLLVRHADKVQAFDVCAVIVWAFVGLSFVMASIKSIYFDESKSSSS